MSKTPGSAFIYRISGWSTGSSISFYISKRSWPEALRFVQENLINFQLSSIQRVDSGGNLSE